jgi:hypothetical protein
MQARPKPESTVNNVDWKDAQSGQVERVAIVGSIRTSRKEGAEAPETSTAFGDADNPPHSEDAQSNQDQNTGQSSKRSCQGGLKTCRVGSRSGTDTQTQTGSLGENRKNQSGSATHESSDLAITTNNNAFNTSHKSPHQKPQK